MEPSSRSIRLALASFIAAGLAACPATTSPERRADALLGVWLRSVEPCSHVPGPDGPEPSHDELRLSIESLRFDWITSDTVHGGTLWIDEGRIFGRTGEQTLEAVIDAKRGVVTWAGTEFVVR